MRNIFLAALGAPLFLSALTGCQCDNYPHNEQATRQDDYYKAGSGPYGGSNSTPETSKSVPAANATPTTAP